MFSSLRTIAASAVLALGIGATTAEAARIDLDTLQLVATPLFSFTDVGASGFELDPGPPPEVDVEFNTADLSFTGSAFDIFGAMSRPSLSFFIDTPTLFGSINLSVDETGFDGSGTILDLILNVDAATDDFAGLAGGRLFATVSGPFGPFGAGLAADGFAETLPGEGFDVAVSTLAPIPLPAGGLLLLGGLAGLGLLRRRRHAV